MSMSVKDLGERFYFAAVPLFLVLASGVAIWFGALRESEFQRSPLRLPHFNYQAIDRDDKLPAAPPEKKGTVLKLKEPRRNIFAVSTMAKKEEKSLEIRELALGLTVVKGQQRYCLTNGVMLAEGGAGNGFLIHRIEENGVWYKIGETLLYLQPGDKVSVDTEGKVREVYGNVKHINNKGSDLKLNKKQVKE